MPADRWQGWTGAADEAWAAIGLVRREQRNGTGRETETIETALRRAHEAGARERERQIMRRLILTAGQAASIRALPLPDPEAPDA